MPRQVIKLTFPGKLIKQPVTFTMAKKFGVVPNIRRAKVTATAGEIVLELTGSREALEKGTAWLVKAGVKVEPVVGSVIE
jgi:ABC-type methionine transport system ATPase subunit